MLSTRRDSGSKPVIGNFLKMLIVKKIQNDEKILGTVNENGTKNLLAAKGSGCGAVDSAVASNTRGSGFASIHRQLLLNNSFLLTVCRKGENNENEKEARKYPFKNKHHSFLFLKIWSVST